MFQIEKPILHEKQNRFAALNLLLLRQKKSLLLHYNIKKLRLGPLNSTPRSDPNHAVFTGFLKKKKDHSNHQVLHDGELPIIL